MDSEFFSYTDIAWQVVPPPDRCPVPAEYVRDLDVGDELTVGIPGQYFVDGQILARTDRETITLPGETAVREALGISAPLHYWMSKAYPARSVTMQWWPVAYTWVYRDARRPDAPSLPEQPPTPDRSDPLSWLDRVQDGLAEPPTRRAKPAREVGPLTGRLLRLQHAPGEWSWRVAVTEAVNVDGDICVHVMPPSVWWITQVTYFSEAPQKIELVALHRLFAYI